MRKFILKFYCLVFCALILNPYESYSQITEIGIWSGVGTFNLNSLRKIPAQTLSQKNIPKLSNTDSYPISYALGIELNRVYESYTFGLLFRFEDTGNQKAYYDLTKELYYKQKGTNLVFGTIGKYHLKGQQLKKVNYYPYFSIKTGYSVSSLSYSVNDENLGSNIIDTFEITSHSIFAEPGLGIRANEGAFIIEPNISFFVPLLQSDYKINGNDRLQSPSEENKNTTAFLGLRIGVTFSIRI